MRALVTGAAGFVGSNLVRKLLRDGHEVVGIDSMTSYYDPELKRANLSQIQNGAFHFVQDDLTSVDLAPLLADTNLVFHQAGQPGVRASWGEEFDVYLKENVGATQRLLEAATRAPQLRRFVYASSSSIYGDAESFPTRETTRPNPLSPYGVSKLAGEHLTTLYAKNFGVPTVSLRYFTVYGPGQRPDMAFTRFTKAAVLDEEITIYGAGTQIRDFTFVDDVVAANIAAATSALTPGDVMNVAGGSNISVNEVLDLLSQIHGAALNVKYVGSVKGDVSRTGGSTDRIREATGWQPEVTLEEGLRRQYEWARTTFSRQVPVEA